MRFMLVALTVLLASNAAGASPNVIVILTDDQDDMGSMAYMPKVHSLIAEQGVTFANSFVNLPMCAPSRASFLTGQAAHNHGISNLPDEEGNSWQQFSERGKDGNTLPVWLKAAGYKTAFFGKYLNGYGDQAADSGGAQNGDAKAPMPNGWDLWYAFFGAVDYYNYAINDNGKIVRFGNQAGDYSTDILKDRVLRFLEAQSRTAGPFFALVAPKAMHAREGKRGEKPPALPSPKYEHRFLDAKLPVDPAYEEAYRAALQSLQSVDDLVETIVDALQGAGLLDDTIIVYTSDNGLLFGEHGIRGKNTAFDGAVRVPLVMRGPGIPANETRNQLVNNLDLVATIEQLAGITPGLAPDGRSLAPLFADANAPWRSVLLVEAKKELAVRTATRKYVKRRNGSEQLYDLIADPGELANKARDPSYASDLARLRNLEEALKNCAGESCWIP